MRSTPNIRVEHARVARSTRKGEAPLLAAHAGRWAGGKNQRSIRLPLLSTSLRRNNRDASVSDVNSHALSRGESRVLQPVATQA